MAVKSDPIKTETPERRKASDLLPVAPAGLLFFLLCFVYLWLVVEPQLMYYGFGTILPDAPQFAAGWTFLRDSLALPGGFVTYLAGFLSLGFHLAWLGAAVIVLTGLCLAELTRRHLRRAGLDRAWVPASLPAVALFLIYSQYQHPLPASLTVSLSLALSLVFEELPPRRPAFRIAVCGLMATIGFWLGGMGAFSVFALLVAIHGLLARRDWKTTVIALPVCLALAWTLAEYLFLIPAGEAFRTQTPFSAPVTAGLDTFTKFLIFLLYGFTPLAVALVLLGGKVLGRRGHKDDVHSPKTKTRHKHALAPPQRRPLRAVMRLALATVPFVLLALGLYFTHNEFRKPYVLSNCYSRLEQWDKVLELAARLPKGRNNLYVNHDITRALYHTGRLPYDMFRYPQEPHALLLTHEQKESDLTQLQLSDIFLELGHVNMAEKLASELVSTKSHCGVALEELGWISIIKGRPDTARVYLEALRRDPIYREQAESLLRGLESGFTPELTAYIDRIRSCMRDDPAGITGTEPVDETLSQLLEHNPRNRMAFEYLMACYLLTGRVDKIAENVTRLADLGYQGIPTLYEEALLIHHGSQGGKLDFTRLNVRRETLQRYLAFIQLRNTTGPQNQQAVLGRLIHDFGASYFFYYSFGRVGQ